MKKLKLSKYYWIPVFILIMMFFAYSAELLQNDQKIEFEGCTSIIVGRLASIDGSTMTSHSCDSGTDRTWINVVPHRTHKKGEVYGLFPIKKDKRA